MNSQFYPHIKNLTLLEIYTIAGQVLEVTEQSSQTYSGIRTLRDAGPSDVALLHNPKYIDDATTTQAGVCITTAALAVHLPSTTIALIHTKPYRIFAQIIVHMYQRPPLQGNIHPSTVIAPSAHIDSSCKVGAFCVIGEQVRIGAGGNIGPHCHISDGVQIGNNAHIESHVSIAYATIGNNVMIKPGARIGQPGFGFHMDEAGPFDVPQIGTVQIGHNVQIGSQTCIDRGSVDATIICDGVRIDNLVQIAHNVYIGPMSIVVAQAGIAGSTRIGQQVVLAGQVGIAGHLDVGDRAKVAAQSGVMRNIKAGETVAGSPSMPVYDWHKQTVLLKNLLKEKK